MSQIKYNYVTLKSIKLSDGISPDIKGKHS